jgi:hypothetical protein
VYGPLYGWASFDSELMSCACTLPTNYPDFSGSDIQNGGTIYVASQTATDRTHTLGPRRNRSVRIGHTLPGHKGVPE